MVREHFTFPMGSHSGENFKTISPMEAGFLRMHVENLFEVVG
jgi:hypothetical protein